MQEEELKADATQNNDEIATVIKDVIQTA